MSALSENLTNLRNKARLTQEQISNAVGVKRSAYAYYELGKSVPKLEVLASIARIYNITVDELIGNEKVPDYGSVLRVETPVYDDDRIMDKLNELSKFEQDVVLKVRMMTIDEREKLVEYLCRK